MFSYQGNFTLITEQREMFSYWVYLDNQCLIIEVLMYQFVKQNLARARYSRAKNNWSWSLLKNVPKKYENIWAMLALLGQINFGLCHEHCQLLVWNSFTLKFTSLLLMRHQGRKSVIKGKAKNRKSIFSLLCQYVHKALILTDELSIQWNLIDSRGCESRFRPNMVECWPTTTARSC